MWSTHDSTCSTSSGSILRARLVPLAISDVGGRPRTAREWCDDFGLVAAINLGMFEPDHSTHTGFMRIGKHVNSWRWVKTYHSILLLGSKTASIADHEPGATYDDHETVVQNLRLIRAPGVNVWQKTDKKWSEAALAIDREGRLLFLISRAPMTMPDFNRMLLELPLGIVRAMHVEGGPEASLSIHGRGIELDLAGSGRFQTCSAFASIDGRSG